MTIKRLLTALFLFVAMLSLVACGALPQLETDENGILIDPVTGENRVGGENNDGSTLKDEEIPPAEETPQEPEKAVYIKAQLSGLNVRKEPTTSSPSLGKLSAGDMTFYLGQEDKWYKTYYRGQTAYVSSRYSSLYEMEKASETVENVILEGVKYLGTPYVYGAVRLHNGDGRINSRFDSNKFDCSSYTQYMYYYGADIIIDVTTRTQIKQGEHVPREQLARGDLMFFTNASRYYNTGIQRVGHVALYLGDNYILHTASDHAVIEKISSTRWRYYIETRRYIDN